MMENATSELPNPRTSALLPSPRLDWRLVIAGPDEQGTRAALERKAGSLGLLDGIVFAGPVYGEAKEQLLESADLFVLPSRSENFGLVVAEALAAGVPVVTTKAAPWAELQGNSASSKVLKCGSSEVPGSGKKDQVDTSDRAHEQHNFRTSELQTFRTSRCGWWVEVGVRPLADALHEAMSLTDEERALMGENGRRLVEAQYRWEAIARRMESVYMELLRS
jgi:glycosyltransferase involved in cell wall biosynthesis